MNSERKEPKQESFFLTILPFSGLGLLLIVALVWRIISASGLSPEKPTPEQQLIKNAVILWQRAIVQKIDIDPRHDFILGNETASITLVEFTDFECQRCRSAAIELKKLLDRYPNDLRLVFKNFPQDHTCNDWMERPMHNYSCSAAALARCAGEQTTSMFWKVHDTIFQESKLSEEVLTTILSRLEGTQSKIENCITTESTLNDIKTDISLARKLRVSGVPVFFLNGRRISDHRTVVIEAVIQHVLLSD